MFADFYDPQKDANDLWPPITTSSEIQRKSQGLGRDDCFSFSLKFITYSPPK